MLGPSSPKSPPPRLQYVWDHCNCCKGTFMSSNMKHLNYEEEAGHNTILTIALLAKFLNSNTTGILSLHQNK